MSFSKAERTTNSLTSPAKSRYGCAGKREAIRVIKTLLVACLIVLPTGAFAGWKVEYGPKVMSLRDDPVGTIARLPAKAPYYGISAFLQIECFVHPEVGSRTLGIVLSKPTTTGALGWRYQFDDGPVIQRGPFSRVSLTVISLGDATQDEFKGLAHAKRLRLTLLPRQSAELPFDFDVTGAAEAINKVPCKEATRR